MQLTAIILTLNEAPHIRDCIASLRWADHVLVFDSFSSDATTTLAAAAGAQIIQHPFQNYAEQRNAALAHVTTDWLFFVDADERCTPKLAAEIRQVIAERHEVAWHVPRHNYIFGKLTKGAGWWPDYQLRLLRHGRVYYERAVHEIGVVDGAVGHLQQPLIHLNYDDLSQFQSKQRSYVDFDVALLQQQQITPKPYTPLTMAARHLYWRLITLDGYRLGLHGLRLSLLMAYYEFLKYRKLQQRLA